MAGEQTKLGAGLYRVGRPFTNLQESVCSCVCIVSKMGEW